MPTPKRGPRLGAGPQHQKLLLANQASELFVHGRIRTTQTKAKTLRPYAEKLITKAKRGDLHARRQVLADLRDRDVVAYLFEEVAPRFAQRNGGYTRILKLGPRKGDGAPMALIELVEQGTYGEGEGFVEEGRARRSRGLFGRFRRRREGGGDVLLDEDVDELGAAEVEDQVEPDSEELADQTAADTDEVTPEEALADVADEDSSTDSLAEATGETAAETPAADEPEPRPAAGGDPSDPTVGSPTEDAGDDAADAGEATGKDAGDS